MHLPPVLSTAEPGSFAQHTFQTRIPAIIDDVIAHNDYPAHIVGTLYDLRHEIVAGVLRPLEENEDASSYWNASAQQHVGKSWLNLPWYWAETFFYRRLLEAVRYFQPGEFYLRDPYATIKQAELAPERTPQTLNALIESMPADTESAFTTVLHASLWGNRIDLSMKQLAQQSQGKFVVESETANLLIDDTARMWEFLQPHAQRVDFICDNSGTELACDLALVDWLLQTHVAAQVYMHVKPQPFFVSDATEIDVTITLNALASAGSQALDRLVQRLERARDEQRLVMTTHPFWTTGLFFHDMPADLRATLAQARLVISKGDVNYRRLIGDCHWDPTTPFASVTNYFPTPVVALRTMKAELIVGLAPGEAERLEAETPTWLTNGKRGVVQANLQPK